MQLKIENEARFKIYAESFAVSPSDSGYTLAYSADGEHFTSYPTQIPAGETCVVTGCAKEMTFKLLGNSSIVKITF